MFVWVRSLFNLLSLLGYETPHLISMPNGITGREVVWPGNHALFPHLLVSTEVGEPLSHPTSLVPAAP